MEEVKAVIDIKQTQQHRTAEDQHTEVIRELRDLRPCHYLFKIENFSHLSNAKADHYESNDFEVGGYKWKLSVYPKGNKKVNEKDHISLYLVLSKSNAFTLHQEVNAYFKLFVYDQIQDKYLTVQDAKWRIRRFRGTKTEWGFDQLVPLDVFNEASNGYLINDCCIFGAEVFVLEPVSKGECASVVEDLITNNTYTWNIQNFAEMTRESYESQVFVIGGHKWTLRIYPKGHEEENGKSLSLFLHLEDSANLKPQDRLYVDYVLCIKDKLHGKHHERLGGNCFSVSDNSWGFGNFMRLSKLNDASEGYIITGAMIVEVQISLITITKEFS